MIDMERAARHVGFALRLPARRARDARVRARPLRDGEADRPRASSRCSPRCWSASRPCTGRAFSPTPSSRSTGCPTTTSILVGTSEVALASLHRDEILAADELPLRYAGFSTLLPPRGGRRRQGHPGHLPRPPVRQGRDVQLRRARRTARPSTSGCWRSRSRSSRSFEIPYRVVAIAVDDLGASAAKKFDCEGVATRPGSLPRAHLVLEHHRLPGPAARHPLPRRRRPSGLRAHA